VLYRSSVKRDGGQQVDLVINGPLTSWWSNSAFPRWIRRSQPIRRGGIPKILKMFRGAISTLGPRRISSKGFAIVSISGGGEEVYLFLRCAQSKDRRNSAEGTKSDHTPAPVRLIGDIPRGRRGQHVLGRPKEGMSMCSDQWQGY
jgi:hypothetical protein